MRKNNPGYSAFIIPRFAAAVVLFSAAALTTWFTFAATPPSGELSLASPMLRFTGGPFVVPNPTAQAGDPICAAPMSCDDYALTVNMTGGPNPDPSKRVKVSVGWPLASADFDIYVLQGTTVVATSASSADPEVITLPAASATYTIRVVPFLPRRPIFPAPIPRANRPSVLIGTFDARIRQQGARISTRMRSFPRGIPAVSPSTPQI